MSYQVLARKYRPQRFEEVVGQEHVTQTLTNAIKQGRIAHAYIFCGPRGTGKTTIARIFAKCLNCTGGPKVDFDDSDPRCIEIAEGRSMDVLEIDGASNNSVEQVRDLREAVKYAPASSKFKIYIIDEVHMLTAAAFNALLKTLEEPPPHVKFMFATTDPEKVLPTILSRCQRFDLRRIPSALIVKHLARIAEAEGVTIEEAALHAIARSADGAMRDAQSTLDQLISFCGNKIVEADVLAMFGLTARDQILALANAICKGDVTTALGQLDELARNGKNLGRLLSDLLNHFRNLMIYQVSKGNMSLLDVSEPEAAALREQSALLSTDAVTRILDVFTDTEWRLRDAVSKRILLEVALFKAAQAKDAANIDTILSRLVALRDSAPPGNAQAQTAVGATVQQETTEPVARSLRAAVTGPERQKAPAAVDAPGSTTEQDEPAPGPQQSSSMDLGRAWSALLEAVGRVTPFVRSYLIKAKPVELSQKAFVIGFEPKYAEYLPLIDVPRNHTLLKTKLKELGIEVEQIKFQKIEEGTAPRISIVPEEKQSEPAPPKIPSPAEFKNDQLIKDALEVFKGTIAEVRD
jgi:DNA polymerase-3 subunit gamma/tau